MQKRSLLGVLAVTAGVSAVSAQTQTVIDFDSFTGPVTNQFPGVSFSSSAGATNYSHDYSKGHSLPNILCSGLIGSTPNCALPTFIDFSDPIDDLTFWAIGANKAGPSAQFNVFEEGVFSETITLISSGGQWNNEFVNLSQFSHITRLEIVNIPLGEGGIGWDTFRFTFVPAPASLALLPLFGAGALRRPRRA